MASKADDAKAAKSEADAPAHPKSVPYLALYKYATGQEKIVILIGAIAAICTGAALPFFSMVLASATAAILTNSNDPDALQHSISQNCILFLVIGIVIMVCSTIALYCWSKVGARLTNTLKQKYLYSALRQDFQYYDTAGGSGHLLNNLTEEAAAVHDAMSAKVARFLQYSATAVTGFIIAFIRGWEMTLVMLAFSPLFVIISFSAAIAVRYLTKEDAKAYARANVISVEALSNVRTIHSCCAEEVVIDSYGKSLEKPVAIGVKTSFIKGAIIGGYMFVTFACYSLALWFGSTRIADGQYTPQSVVNVLFAAILGAFSMSAAMPNVQMLSKGKAAAAHLYAVIDRQPEVSLEGGITPDKVVGDIVLTDVNFSYPANPDVMILKNFNLTIHAGTSVALVGESGSGKSTIVGLMERFYDPNSGTVTLDGNNLKDLNLTWLRSKVGLVSQEPILFTGTLFENLSMGNDNPTKEQVIAAAKSANIHGFIMTLPDKYDTKVGEKGAQLSGGQKQRLAIARALLKDPQILLLDEATSALDTKSERIVQKALDNIMVGRTSIIIAHRLSTVVKADNIAVIQRGVMIEQGNHESLMKLDGFYAGLAKKQNIGAKFDDDAGADIITGAEDEVEETAAATVTDAPAVEGMEKGADVGKGDGKGIITGAYGAIKGQVVGGVGVVTDGLGVVTDGLTVVTDQIKDVTHGYVDIEGGVKGVVGLAAGGVKTVAHEVNTFMPHMPKFPSFKYINKMDAEYNFGLFIGGYNHQILVTLKGFFEGLFSLRPKKMTKDFKDKIVNLPKTGCLCCGMRILGTDNGRVNFVSSVGNESNFRRIAMLNAPEWPYCVVGIIGSAGMGAVQPVYALILSNAVNSLYIPTISLMQSQVSMYAGIIAAVGAAALLFNILSFTSFGAMGHKLAMRVRLLILRSLLRQEVGYYDREENKTGVLVSRLASDARAVKGQFGDSMGLIVQNVCTIIIALALAFSYSWNLAIVVLAGTPSVIIVAVISINYVGKYSTMEAEQAALADGTAAESLYNLRTVAALGIEKQMVENYSQKLQPTVTYGTYRGIADGAGYGIGQFCVYGLYALAFWYGGQLIVTGKTEATDILKVFLPIFIAAFSAGNAQTYFPDVAKGGAAAERVFNIVDRVPQIDNLSEEGEEPLKCDGHIQLFNVKFAYPSRPDAPIFHDFTIDIPAGTSMALVGESGSGKSTIVGLVQRFYAPMAGTIYVDGKLIETLNLRWLREQIGVVGQEPVLFNMTIRENICYGSGVIDDATLEKAAEAAACDFIKRLPDGFDTLLGAGGTLLSGGQKQRIAIARAILKNPKIFLLDEATSALDAESEKLVTVALEEITKNKTTIIVAHKLVTVQNATCISVMERGNIVESGNHKDLMQRKGIYANLVRLQQGSGAH